MRRGACALLTVALAVGAGGCAPWATYPPDEGALDLSGPRTEPVPTLMAEAVRFMHSRHGTSDDFAVNLPPGTPPQVYEWVLRRLGAGRPMATLEERAYHVTKVRVRGLKAQVDVFYPTRAGEYQFATLSFQGDLMKGYRHDSTRIWRTGQAPPPPGLAATAPVPADPAARTAAVRAPGP